MKTGEKIKMACCWINRLALLLLLFGAQPAYAQTETVEYIHTDALGSPVAVTNETGQVIERTNWEPYGAAIGKPNYQGPGYTGHVMDSATGLTYMQQRYYDPQLGKMLSVDPVTAYGSGDWRHFNVYAYAYNNPYKFTDPDGRCGACDRFSDQFARDAAAGNSQVYAPFEKPAIALTTAALPGGPLVRALVGMASRLFSKADEGPAPSSTPAGPLKNRSGDIEASANSARTNPYPREVSGHANQRMQTRDKAVTPEVMETAAVSGKRTLDQATGKTRHDLPASQSPTGRGATVVTNPRGGVVTVIDKGTKFEPKP